MTSIRLVLCAVAVVVTSSLALAQDEPAADGSSDAPRPPRQYDRGYPDRPYGFSRRGISPEEWEAISVFMEENFPNRWAVYQSIVSVPGREMLAREMRIRIVTRYRQLERVRHTNESLYNVTIEQTRAEDQVWGTVRAWRELAETASASERESTLEKLRDQVRAFTLKTFDEREARLASIRETLAREEKELAADRKRIDALVEERVQTLTSNNPFRGPDGMGPKPEGAENPEGERRGPGNRSERRGGGGSGGGFAAPQQEE